MAIGYGVSTNGLTQEQLEAAQREYNNTIVKIENLRVRLVAIDEREHESVNITEMIANLSQSAYYLAKIVKECSA